MLGQAVHNAEVLLADKDDLVRKGYAWMLKEASKHFPEEVLRFVLRHRDRLPRMALRIAVAKLPAMQQHEALQRADSKGR